LDEISYWEGWGRRFRRRRLVQFGVAAAGLAAFGCSSTGPVATPSAGGPAGPAGTAAPAAAATPAAAPAKLGGVLQTRFLRDPEGWDPHKIFSTTTIVLTPLIFNGLVQQDPYDESRTIADLAESWEATPDSTGYTFHLRSGVKWHDGQPFSSADAAYSLDRIAHPTASYASHMAGLLNGIKAIDTPDANTLRVTLAQPDAGFLTKLTHIMLMMLPKHVEDINKNPIGTGAFKLKGVNSGVSIEFVKNPDYYRKGYPYLDGVTFNIIADANATIAAFRAGQLDLPAPDGGNLVTPKTLDQVKASVPGLQVVEAAGGSFKVRMNEQKPPFSDARVRRAIHLAIDRREFVQAALGGGGLEAVTDMLPTEFGGKWSLPASEMASLPGYRQPKDQDLAEAKQLLRQAGVDPATFKPSMFYSPFFTNQPVVVVEQLKRIGVEVNNQVVQTPELYSRAPKGDFEMLFFGGEGVVDDPDSYLSPFYLKGGTNNWEGIDDAQVASLYAQQAKETDPNKRVDLVRQIQRRLLDIAAEPVLAWSKSLIVLRPTVKNFPPAKGNFPNRYRFEAVWLDK
jgi:peptide/nickel transport system substrate-binding protein